MTGEIKGELFELNWLLNYLQAIISSLLNLGLTEEYRVGDR